MSSFIHQFMCRHELHGVIHDGCYFYPWATATGIAVMLGIMFAFSAIVTWFIFAVIKPKPGCIYVGKIPFLPLYAGDPSQHNKEGRR